MFQLVLDLLKFSFLLAFHSFFLYLLLFIYLVPSVCTPWLLKRYAKWKPWAWNDAWKRNENILAFCVVLCNHCSALKCPYYSHYFMCVSAILSSDPCRKNINVVSPLSQATNLSARSEVLQATQQRVKTKMPSLWWE